MKRKEDGKYGETHYMVLNTYKKPDEQTQFSHDEMPF